ncbi:MAG: hypothetical protein KDC50_07305 [Flavobacterium sp.]|uniref:hypothetical protein n=1 Tax=Flavobacterium sp. TaxID=239 RepID=UPI001D79988D|nr:hypothetical protein [Flavobacterium sp.]
MKKLLALVFILNFSFVGKAQFDAGNKSVSPSGNFGISPSSSGTSIFSSTEKDEKKSDSYYAPLRKEKEIDLTKNYGFVKPDFKIQPNLNGESKMLEEYKRGKHYGSFISKSKFVKVLCRDHQAIDGDRVSIILNDKVVEANIFLDNEFSVFYIELAAGFNNLEFIALNQGTSGPNTAQFAVLDEFDSTLMSNIWNLATGAKASMSIFRE